MTLEGTLFVPETPGKHAAVVLVHGSNSANREKYRAEAEMFAKAGIAALIYDKRADGFSKSRAGDRSYQLLSQDVNAAVDALRSRTDIDQESIGLWGISEGAWTASLAASQPNSDVAFLITVGAVGVQPVQQQSWLLVNRLHDQGVSADSMVRSITRHGLQLAVSAGWFAEATYDPAPAFEALKQPVLAIWGENDRVGPALESSRIIQDALDRGGNEQYTIRFFPNAGHLLKWTTDGNTLSDAFAPGYSEAMTSWVTQVSHGNAPKPSVIGIPPQQDHFSPAGIGQLSWYHSAWLHFGVALILIVIFVGSFLKSLIRSVRLRKTKQKMNAEGRYAIVLAATASLTILGFISYFGFLMSSGAKNLAPVFLDRTLAWFILQALALIAAASTALLGRSLWLSRSHEDDSDRVSSMWLLAGGIVFIPWALYWQLLMP
jgi:pimeloyl-ACP methyl ester carboxylesterase